MNREPGGDQPQQGPEQYEVETVKRPHSHQPEVAVVKPRQLLHHPFAPDHHHLCQPPGQHAADDAEPDAGIKEGTMNKGIGRPHQLEHLDLGSLVEDIEAQGVADDEQHGGEQQHGDAGDGVAQQVHDPLQPGQPLQIQLALLHPVFVVELAE